VRRLRYHPARASAALMDMSKIGIEIFVLLASLVLVLVCLIAVELYSLLRYWRNPTHPRVRDIPLDYIPWQLATVPSTDGNANLSEKDLGRFGYQWMDDMDTLDFQEVAPGVGFLSLIAFFAFPNFANGLSQDRNLLPLLAVETDSIAASKRYAE
jgi:hypothetical protein